MDGFLDSQKIDIETRVEDEKQRDLEKIININEISEGFVMEDERVKVSALKVVHGLLENCFAFKFETKDKKVVFSGDTIYSPLLADFSKDADVSRRRQDAMYAARQRMQDKLDAESVKFVEKQKQV